MAPNVSPEATNILQYWQAIEIFSPQKIVSPNPKAHIVDLRRGDPMPREPGSHLDGIELYPGYVWRHEVFGGIYRLQAVRDALVDIFGADEDDPDGERNGRPSASRRCSHAR